MVLFLGIHKAAIMKPEWKDFLLNEGAELDHAGDRVETFGNPTRELQVINTGEVICDLSHFGLISVSGDDAATFMQGQFTNDINQVSNRHSQLSAYCNPKGRMYANFRIFKRENTFYIELPGELLKTVLKRLSMFVLRAKVTLDDASESLMRIGVSGNRISREFCDIIGVMPAKIDDCVEFGDTTIIRVPGLTPSYEIHGQLETIQSLWQQFNVDSAPVGAGAWQLLNIQAGVGVITAATSEAFVPQMTNQQLLGGISFSKGCYTGQEIVARMHYLGKLKKRMYRVRIATDDEVRAGEALFAADSAAGQNTGAIVNAQPHPDGGYEALAVIQISDAEAGGLRLHDRNGPKIKVLELPYAFESGQEKDVSATSATDTEE
jgi:folate-binding protein YgfZ